MKMKDFSKVDLPREKLEKYGPKKLSDSELLAILLGSGIEGKNVLTLSKEILTKIKKLGTANVDKKALEKIRGLGKTKTSQILAVIELGKRLNPENMIEILTAKDIWNCCADFRESKREHFVAFYLDTQNRLIERQIISIGTLNASLVHPREIFELALKNSAASVIFAHNHPSGEVGPSDEDEKITKRLVEAGKLLGIEVADHVIVAKTNYLSFQQKGLL